MEIKRFVMLYNTVARTLTDICDRVNVIDSVCELE